VFGSTLSSCLPAGLLQSLAANSHPLVSSLDFRNSFEMNTYRNRISNPFKMNTYEKRGRGWRYPHSTILTVALLLFPSIFLAPIVLCEGCRARQLISHLFNRFRTLCENTRVYPRAQSSHAFARSPWFPRTKPMTLPTCLKTSFPLHPWPHGGTIFSVVGLSGSSVTRETFPLSPVSNYRERTTGSTARLIQQSARDRRPGPLAIRRRYPASPLFKEKGRKKGRPGKASSVRLGERSFVGS
jgi:hypothetical protein